MSHSETDKAARARALDALGARRRRQRHKSEVSALRELIADLTAHLEELRRERAVSGAYARALTQRQARRDAEAANRELKRALAAVRMRTCDIRTLVSMPVLTAGVNMRDLVHTPSYVRKDPAKRARDLQAFCESVPLDLAMDIVLRETAALSSSPVHVQSHVAPSRPGELAVTTIARVEVDSVDCRNVFQAACSAYGQCGLGWRDFRKLEERNRVVETPDDATTYAVWEEKHEHEGTGDALWLAVGSLTYARLTDAYGVAVWDHIDVDEQYPALAVADGRRHCTASLVVRVETCADGIERVVCRNVCTKIYRHNRLWARAAPTLARDMAAIERQITRAIRERVAAMDGLAFHWWDW